MRKLRLAVTLLALALLAPLLTPASASAFPGAQWLEPDEPYAANFPDPSIMVHGGTYYGYATTTGGAYIPSISSTDLSNWVARSAYMPSPYPDPIVDPFFNDALVAAPGWAAPRTGHNHVRAQIIAPGVDRIGTNFLAYYAVNVGGDRFCISSATALDPQGPFWDASGAPLVCSSDPNGSIDPEPFIDPTSGTPYLLWKDEGVPGVAPTEIYIRQLDPSGSAFAAGSVATPLLQTAKRWEGNVIENPSMVYHDGRYLLFYSANEWQSRDYAIGVAVCAGPTGPCTRQNGGDWPLLGSRGLELGPGGADAFVDLDGKLRIGYHRWNAPYTSYPDYSSCNPAGTCQSQGQRFLEIEEVLTLDDGTLSIGGAQEITIGYTAEEWASVQFAADRVGVTPEWLSKFGIFALGFVVKLSGNDLIHEPISPAPSTTGVHEVTVRFEAGEERVAMDWLSDHYLLTPAQAMKAGAAFQIFLAGLAAG